MRYMDNVKTMRVWRVTYGDHAPSESKIVATVIADTISEAVSVFLCQADWLKEEYITQVQFMHETIMK